MTQVDKSVPEQQTTIVAQLEAELENAKAYGNETRVAAIEKQLKELGVKKTAAEKRAEAAEEKKSEEPKKSEPEGRHVPRQQHTT